MDRLPPLAFFFFVDDGGGEARSMLDCLLPVAEAEDAPGRLGIEKGEGAGPSAGALLRLLVPAVLAVRNFIVRFLLWREKMARDGQRSNGFFDSLD